MKNVLIALLSISVGILSGCASGYSKIQSRVQVADDFNFKKIFVVLNVESKYFNNSIVAGLKNGFSQEFQKCGVDIEIYQEDALSINPGEREARALRNSKSDALLKITRTGGSVQIGDGGNDADFEVMLRLYQSTPFKEVWTAKSELSFLTANLFTNDVKSGERVGVNIVNKMKVDNVLNCKGLIESKKPSPEKSIIVPTAAVDNKISTQKALEELKPVDFPVLQDVMISSSSKLTKNDAESIEARVKKRQLEIEEGDKWQGAQKSKDALLKNAEASPAATSQGCKQGVANLMAANLASHEITIENLKFEIVTAHENFLAGRTNNESAALKFNLLKIDVELARKFYNMNISRHCARGSRMIEGLNKSSKDTELLINLMNNFVADLNKNK